MLCYVTVNYTYTAWCIYFVNVRYAMPIVHARVKVLYILNIPFACWVKFRFILHYFTYRKMSILPDSYVNMYLIEYLTIFWWYMHKTFDWWNNLFIILFFVRKSDLPLLKISPQYNSPPYVYVNLYLKQIISSSFFRKVFII